MTLVSRGVRLALLLALVAAPARAQVLLAPSLGGAAGGDTAEPPVAVYAISIGYWGGEPFGVDVEVAHLPGFFRPRAETVPHIVGSLTTVAFNIVLGTPTDDQVMPRVRPYVSGGPVLFRLWPDRASVSYCSNRATMGFGVGGGLLAGLSDHVGLRFDLRYFHDPRRSASRTVCGVTNLEQFSGVRFARGAVGIAWRF